MAILMGSGFLGISWSGKTLTAVLENHGPYNLRLKKEHDRPLLLVFSVHLLSPKTYLKSRQKRKLNAKNEVELILLKIKWYLGPTMDEWLLNTDWKETRNKAALTNITS